MRTFENFYELEQYNYDLANSLLEEVGTGGWQNEELYLYDSLEDYAEYELMEGWYARCGFDFNTNSHGAPNPFDYIDLESLGQDLANTWDNTMNYTDGEVVIQTSYGW